ncbi:VOC family protein [Streptomyces lunalinharesii]|uniref:VOC family protein n=1 Tax=Streptomyces lunalinharesii TaxID=333384 RepID=UPI0031D4E65F
MTRTLHARSAQEAWCGSALGLVHVDERLEMPEAGVRTVVLSDAGGLRVEFVERPGSSPAAPAAPFTVTAVQTFAHLALQVPYLDAAFGRLTGECGAAPVSPPASGVTTGMRYAYIADPEGNLLELIEV